MTNKQFALISATFLTLILGLASLGAAGNTQAPFPVRTTYLLLTVTVWSDGSIDTLPPTELDALSARRLADRLRSNRDAQQESDRVTRMMLATLDNLDARLAATAELVAMSNTAKPSTTAKTDTQARCTAIASSTSQRCRNRPMNGHSRCYVHAETP